jgi:hypothetical protein
LRFDNKVVRAPVRHGGLLGFRLTLRLAFAPLSQAPLPNWPGAGDAKHGGGMVTLKARLRPITPEAIRPITTKPDRHAFELAPIPLIWTQDKIFWYR